MPDLPPYQADHLFLLVGENPLPNYVAAKLLRSPQGKLYLVHSTDTLGIARQLKEILQGEVTEIFLISLGNQQANAFEIKKHISSRLNQLKNDRGKIGLHYTGGTKAMAVHVYRAMQDWAKDSKRDSDRKSQDIIFSYLDPSRLHLCFDQENAQPQSKLVDLALQPPLKTILKLHRLSWKSDQQPERQPLLPDLAQEMATHFAQLTDNEISQYQSWCNQKIRNHNALTHFESNGKTDWKSEKELSNLTLSIPADFPETLRSWMKNRLTTSGNQMHLGISRDRGFGTCKALCDWISGIWLEYYVLHQVQQLEQAYQLHDVVRSLSIDDPNFKRDKPQFEFDIVFLRGYQLFGISCTTSRDYSTCKLKLFEAYARAQQMGGAEVRVALVCAYERPNNLRKELTLGREDPRIRVWGKDDLLMLHDKLSAWIEQGN